MFPLGTSGVGKTMPMSCIGSHPSQDVLEEYIFRRLSEAGLATVEEHLLICQQCRDVLQELDDFVQAMKGCAEREAEKIPAAGQAGRRKVAGYGVALATMVVGLAVVTLLPVVRHATPIRSVQLVAFRGGEGGSMIPVQAGASLRLTADVADLAPSSIYRIEIVNASGAKVWAGSSSSSGGTVKMPMPGLKPGVYWARLYSGGQLQREFGLRSQ